MFQTTTNQLSGNLLASDGANKSLRFEDKKVLNVPHESTVELADDLESSIDNTTVRGMA